MLKTLYDQDFQHMTHGDSGIRTHDLLNAIQALSQLSYTPERSAILRDIFDLVNSIPENRILKSKN